MGPPYDLYPCDSPEVSREVTTLVRILRESSRVIIVTGAGISTSVGIPDYQSSSTLLQEYGGRELFEESTYRDPQRLAKWHEFLQMFVRQVLDTAPSRTHKYINRLAQEGRLLRVFDQNIDGLLTQRQSHLFTDSVLDEDGPWPNVIQLHGDILHQRCIVCHWVSSINLSLFHGDSPPPCPKCTRRKRNVGTDRELRPCPTPGGLRADVRLYNRFESPIMAKTLHKIIEEDTQHQKPDQRPNALLVIGTTLHVPDAQQVVKKYCEEVQGAGGYCVWISKEKPRRMLGVQWDLIVEGSCDEIVEAAGY